EDTLPGTGEDTLPEEGWIVITAPPALADDTPPDNDPRYRDPGDNKVSGTTGDDTLYGSLVDDEISGGAGRDWLYGGGGDDVINGGAGNDQLYGGKGDDVLNGGAGNDIFYGGVGDDVINGGAGNDRLNGDDGDDVLDGGAGNDEMFGGLGDDELIGGAGNDRLFGGGGSDVLHGDAGNDAYYFAVGNGADTVFEMWGEDRLVFDEIDYTQLWFERSGDDLEISVRGTDDAVTVVSWFLDEDYQIELITADGATLEASAVAGLVDALAGYDTPPDNATLAEIVGSHWDVA
ncbi:MAG: hypothetical protein LBE06_05320, partial [Azoarcus sp.]|nr:hypothetical protein [Azoarcus sp.]